MNAITSTSRRRRALLGAGFTLLLACGATAAVAGTAVRADSGSWCAPRCDQIVGDWSLTAYQVIVAGERYANPMSASRVLAMMHLAMHDAVNAVTPRYATYALTEGDPQADAAVAAATAAHDLMLALYPGQKALLATALDRTLAEAGTGAGVQRGRALGARAAAAVLARRAQDGSKAEEKYAQGTAPGEYRFVPGTDFIAAPHWRSVEPFALKSAAQFRVAPPPAVTGAEYAKAFDEVRAYGGTRGSQRTADQSHYAAFWYEFSDIGWNRIARVVARQQPQDLVDRARFFALLNAALADAYIAGWDSKLHYNFWRPVSAIRLAESDGNGATTADRAWSSFLATPPIQDHPSTHSALGAAGATVLAGVFGRDDIAFSFTSTSADPANAVRRFASFSDAARENADSRVMAGLHFRFATEAGLKLGEQIGQYTLARFLQPLD